jgi:hypothetical protein
MDSQPVADPNAQTLCPFDAADSGGQIRAQKDRVGGFTPLGPWPLPAPSAAAALGADLAGRSTLEYSQCAAMICSLVSPPNCHSGAGARESNWIVSDSGYRRSAKELRERDSVRDNATEVISPAIEREALAGRKAF